MLATRHMSIQQGLRHRKKPSGVSSKEGTLPSACTNGAFFHNPLTCCRSLSGPYCVLECLIKINQCKELGKNLHMNLELQHEVQRTFHEMVNDNV